MVQVEVVAQVLADARIRCKVDVGSLRLELTGTSEDIAPGVEGDSILHNQALINNAWSFAKYTREQVTLTTTEEQRAAGRLAASHKAVAQWIAELAAHRTEDGSVAWCSGCFAQTTHCKVDGNWNKVPAYLCESCGSPTLPCIAPGCEHFAVRARGAIRVPRYCAEHRHEIPGFEKAGRSMGSLGNYKEHLDFESHNLTRGLKIAGLSLASALAATPLAFAMVPAIGGAVGTLTGLSGAAAVSHGLALLGGGSIAAGGLGMAGGTAVVTAFGASVGAALGASVSTAYLGEDKSFHIELLRAGAGVPVVVCNGFLSEGSVGWGEWREIITRRYPESPVYRVHWGAKELKALGLFLGDKALKSGALVIAKQLAAQATKKGAAKISPLAPAFMVAGMARNPWHTAKSRADKTGVVLADLLARTDANSYVLVGHSLGARAMLVATQTLGSNSSALKVDAVHLLGAAVGSRGDWRTLNDGVEGQVFNYHSMRDQVLRNLYKVASAGKNAAGYHGLQTTMPKIQNVDVSSTVDSHSGYFANLVLA